MCVLNGLAFDAKLAAVTFLKVGILQKYSPCLAQIHNLLHLATSYGEFQAV